MTKFIIYSAFFGLFGVPPQPAPLSGPNCSLVATLVSTTPALCNGTATGSAVITVTNATAPLDFILEGVGPILPNGNLNNLFSAGNHFVVVRDAMGCLDTVSFTISEPSPIQMSINTTPVICNGDDTGSGAATVAGGTGALSVTWQGCAGGPIYSGLNVGALFAGCYSVKATDGNGCTVTQSVNISEPAPFTFNSTQDSVDCFGGNNGAATIFVSGGTQPYMYLWDNGSTLQMATGLNANFHTVAITDAANCQAFTFVQVLQPGILKIDSVTVRSVNCFGENNGRAGIYISGGTMPFSYKWSDPLGQTTKIATSLTAGLYTVTVTDFHGCSIVNNSVVPTPTDLLVTVSNLTGEKCAGVCEGTATVSATGGTPQYNISWSNPNVPPGTFAANSLCAGMYVITVTDSKGCSKTIQAAIPGITPINVQLTGKAPTCAGLLNGSVNSTVGGGVLPLTYKWSNGATTQNIQSLTCGMYFLTVTDANSCTKVDTVDLICPQTINIINSSAEPVKCFGGSDGTASVLALGGSGNLTYLWSDPLQQITAQATGLTAGTYTLTITDGNGCTNSSTVVVPQANALTANFQATNISCFGGSNGKLLVQPNGGTGPYTYLWSNTATTNMIENLVAGNYSVTISDVNGCTLVSLSPQITQPSTDLQLTVNQTKKSCFGQNNGSATAIATGSNGAPFTFVWDNGQTGPNASMLTVGMHTVTASDVQGCTNSKTIQIGELDSILINAAPVLPTCFGVNNGILAVNLVSGGIGNGILSNYKYTWSVPNAPNSAVLNGLAGNQNYFLTVSDQQGCSGQFQFYLVQPPQITANSNSTDVTCSGLSDGTAQISGIKNAKGTVSFKWSTGATTDTVGGLAAGIYSAVITDSLGCKTNIQVEVKTPDSLSVAFEVTQLLCTNERNAAVQATVSGGVPDYTYQWNNGGTSANLSSLPPGVFALTAKDKNGCIIMDSVKINRPDSIVINANVVEPKCFGDSNGRIKLSVTGGKQPYKYRVNDANYGGASVFIGLSAGIYALEIKDVNGCTATLIDTLVQPLPVTVTLPADTTIQLGQSLELSAEVSNAVGMVNLIWNSSLQEAITCVDSLFCNEIKVTPLYSNRYTLQAQDANGCYGRTAIRVTVNKTRGIYVPTGFSPDGNAINDLLMVHGNGEQINNIRVFRVFDRWGELMYEDQNFKVNDASRGWDGRFRGKNCDPAVFVWYVEAEFLDGYIETATGNTTLVR
jgi:gliding motility-associated-like protein